MSKRLIVNADDFGRSASINEAVIRAHQEGILTTASLMVNGDAAAEAVELARQNPKLGVGLHLSLICGSSALPHSEIPGLTNEGGVFSDSPAWTGARYFFSKRLHRELGAEIGAQFKKFKATGLPLDHVNGHLHFHLHPVVFGILMRGAREWGIKTFRLTREPLRIDLRLGRGRWFYRLSHALIFSLLARRSAPILAANHLKHADRVFGLLENSLVDEAYAIRLLEGLPDGVSELYSHPSMGEFRNEFEALVSPQVRSMGEARGIQLVRYQDLI